MLQPCYSPASARARPWSAVSCESFPASMTRFDYTHALVRGLPSTLPDGLTLHPPPVPVDMGLAAEQHEAYGLLLRQLIPNVHEIEADDRHPGTVLLELDRELNFPCDLLRVCVCLCWCVVTQIACSSRTRLLLWGTWQ